MLAPELAPDWQLIGAPRGLRFGNRCCSPSAFFCSPEREGLSNHAQGRCWPEAQDRAGPACRFPFQCRAGAVRCSEVNGTPSGFGQVLDGTGEQTEPA